MVHKIYIFRGIQNNYEDPAEFLKALKWAYRLNYKQEKLVKNGTRQKF